MAYLMITALNHRTFISVKEIAFIISKLQIFALVILLGVFSENPLLFFLVCFFVVVFFIYLTYEN